MTAPVRLCALNDIADNSSNGFIAATPEGRRGFLVIRKGDQAHVYINSCPHIGSPLDFEPGKFLNLEKTHIMCSTHGALFTIEDGHCISGPCAGQDLEKANARVTNGEIFLIY